MKLLTFCAIIALSSILTTARSQQVIPFDDKRWVIQAQGQLLEPYKGKNSIYLQNGMAYLKDLPFSDGIIEFDIYLGYQTSFSGFVFRLADPLNYEEFYLRAQLPGYPDACQYTPVFNGDPAWQLYHDQFDGVNDGFISWKPRGKGNGYNTVVNYVYDRWMHVKFLVKGSQAEFYLDDMDNPIMFIPQLKMDGKPGAAGIKSQIGAAHYANFTVTNSGNINFKTKDLSVPAYQVPKEAVAQWQVSSTFREDVLKNKYQLDPAYLKNLSWKSLQTEAGDFVNLSRSAAIKDSANTMIAKFTIYSDKDQVKRLNIGYSDRLNAYFNNQLVYSGTTTFRSRDFRYLGTIGYFDALYLPLKKGENTIQMVVSETFGGWAAMAKWENMDGITFR